MADEINGSSEHVAPGGEGAVNVSCRARKKTSKQPLIIVLAVAAFVIISSLLKQQVSINWVRDYQAGIEQAREENKPVLLAFYKKQMRFCTLMEQNTYNNRDVCRPFVFLILCLHHTHVFIKDVLYIL